MEKLLIKVYQVKVPQGKWEVAAAVVEVWAQDQTKDLLQRDQLSLRDLRLLFATFGK